MQEQVEDQGLAGLARSRPVATRPTASADHTVLAPVPAPLDCPYLHLDDDGPACVALAPAIRLSRRQVELVCAVAAHVACPRLIRADAGRAPTRIEPPAVARRRDRAPIDATDPVGLAAATATATAHEPAAAGTARASATITATGTITAPAPATPPATTTPPGPITPPATTTPPGPITPPATPTTREPGTIEDAARRGPALAATRPATTPRATSDATPEEPSRITATLASVRAAMRERIVLRPAIAAASAILIATLLIVIAILSARGGLNLPADSSSPLAVLASASPSLPSATPVASPPATASPIGSPSPSASSSAVASPWPSASPPFPPDRLAVLTPCASGQAGCYQYRIKPNDSLRNLATFFGVAYPALLAANPQVKNPSLVHVGQLITVPVPTS